MTLRKRWVQRLRLLLIAGLAAPAGMVGSGLLIRQLARRDAAGLLHGPSLASLTWGAVTGLISMGLIALLYKSDKRLERAIRQSGMKVGLEALEMAGYPVMLTVVSAAAFGEEVLFRGGLQPVIGLIPAALLFGFSHGGWQREMWAYVLAAVLAGCLFGFLYQATGDLWAPIFAHMVHNLGSTLMLGRKLDVSWDGGWPRIRLVPEAHEEEEHPQSE
jgi:membrane protease YdiL (CAAX protease family)